MATAFVQQNDAFVKASILSAAPTADPYWYHVALTWEHLAGLVAGYEASGQEPLLSRTDFLLLNAMVDLSSIIHRPFLNSEAAVREYTRETTHCSALVKVAPDLSELWTSHNTWTGFFTMLRVIKKITLPFNNPTPGAPKLEVPAEAVVFSGYFGTLASTDDFFVLSSGLVVQETTNAVYNMTLLATISPRSVLTWARSIVANRIAADGEAWTQIFRRHNSGTINNQWMVVDYNRFEPGKPLVAGTLWVLEQLPGFIEAADMTRTLAYGYWPSYNRPYFESVRDRSGAKEMASRYGEDYSYELYSRGQWHALIVFCHMRQPRYSVAIMAR